MNESYKEFSVLHSFSFRASQKAMATHSSVLAWRIPGMGEPGRLPSMESHRVGHDWSDLAAAAGIEPSSFRSPALAVIDLFFTPSATWDVLTH